MGLVDFVCFADLIENIWFSIFGSLGKSSKKKE